MDFFVDIDTFLMFIGLCDMRDNLVSFKILDRIIFTRECTIEIVDNIVNTVLVSLSIPITKTYKHKDIKELLEDEQRILYSRTENSTSDSIRRILERAKAKVTVIVDTLNKGKENIKEERSVPLSPQFPFPEPRPYQKEAFNNWKASQKGLFAMATGTGKTLTSLNCLLQIYNKFKFYQA